MEAWHFIATAFGVVFTTLGGTFGLMKLTDTRTGRLEERIDRLQDKGPCIRARGATHVHCHRNDLDADRLAEETDLLKRYTNAYQPYGCNVPPSGVNR